MAPHTNLYVRLTKEGQQWSVQFNVNRDRVTESKSHNIYWFPEHVQVDLAQALGAFESPNRPRDSSTSIGMLLGEALLWPPTPNAPEPRNALAQELVKFKKHEVPLRIWLDCEADPKAAGLPWEVMRSTRFLKSGGFRDDVALLLQGGISLIRWYPNKALSETPPCPPANTRVLQVIYDASLNEWQPIQRLTRYTLETVTEQLGSTSFQSSPARLPEILHFAGHGGAQSKEGPSRLANQIRSITIDNQTLTKWSASPTLRLAFLASCESASRKGKDEDSKDEDVKDEDVKDGDCPTLAFLEAKCPVVIGFPYKVAQENVSRIVSAFYEELCRTPWDYDAPVEIDEVLAKTRRKLDHEHPKDDRWHPQPYDALTPVIYAHGDPVRLRFSLGPDPDTGALNQRNYFLFRHMVEDFSCQEIGQLFARIRGAQNSSIQNGLSQDLVDLIEDYGKQIYHVNKAYDLGGYRMRPGKIWYIYEFARLLAKNDPARHSEALRTLTDALSAKRKTLAGGSDQSKTP